MELQLNTSWLSGKYPEINAEINTNLPYVSIGGHFWQGEEADSVIDDIFTIWEANDLTVQQAIQKYETAYL